MRDVLAGLLLVAMLCCAACASPPEKEMNQARGAIEAAQAAGADQYATTEYQAAVTALKRSEDAVTQRDYRQALNDALDAREQAEHAARTAADQKAAARSDAERELRQVQALLRQLTARVKAAEVPRPTTRRGRRQPAPVSPERATIATAESSVQKARTAMERQDYLRAQEAIRGVTAELQAAIHRLEQPPPAAPRIRKRR